MLADDELCLCFHVSYRKVIRYIDRNTIVVPSQVSECLGAGTGCGWCRKQITRLVSDVQLTPPRDQNLDDWLRDRSPTATAHRQGREEHRRNLADGTTRDTNELNQTS
jgi:bacterioferritin-associated ferredoxin